MRKFFVVLCCFVTIICGGYLYNYFAGQPVKSNINADGEKYILSWDAYPEAKEYSVYINDQLIKTVTTTKTDITEYLINDATYDVEIKTHSVGDGEVTVYSEDYEYQAKSCSDFQRKTFFMNGEIYDYNIESLHEYEMFVWYNILYRNNAARFYNSCSKINIGNIQRITYDYIVSYPEYDGVHSKSQYAAKFSDKIYMLKNLEYYLPQDFTLSTASCTNEDNSGLYNFKQGKSQASKATAYNLPYEKAEISSERHFPIDEDSLTKVKVYNTEQLFMVAQYGACPIFPVSGCVAEQVYNNAREVLRQINNSDSLTDYQKALNIYRYLCMNVKYDNILFSYMDSIQNSSVMTFGKFSPFYLEGVFYDMDNQVAVCDGLSKAFALMCRIEGIEATKINGVAAGGDHAWNKVKIGDNYHIVDTTWGTAAFENDDELQEALSHAYFLVSEWDLSTHESTFEIGDQPTTNYGYYKNTYVDGVSTYVTTKAEFITLRDKAFKEGRSSIEIEFSPSFAFEIEMQYGSIKAFLDSNKYGGNGGYIISSLAISDTIYLIQTGYTNINI